MHITIRDSFLHNLPYIPYPPPPDLSGYRETKPSSGSTAVQIPPMIYLRESSSTLATLAKNAIERLDSINEFLPALEKTFFLSNEADAVRAAANQLVHPIDIVLPELAPSAGILCKSEVAYSNNRCRIDMRWSARDKTVAILEFKNTKVLNKDGFKKAECKDAKDVAIKIAQGKTARKPTLLEGNAMAVSKQATKYSSVCKDIALFDWNCMMIYDFHDVHENALPAKPARGIFFDEQDPEHNETFRMVLLGFIIRGLERSM